MDAYEEILEKIKSGRIRNHDQLEREKIILAKKYGLDSVIKNADIILYLEKNRLLDEKLMQLLRTKPMRTLSGVANIAVMWLPKDANASCPGRCIYCPRGTYTDAEGVIRFAPKSYTGHEPATMRAMRNNYDPCLQIRNRLKQLKAIGHPTDKCELIIMGGTFMSWDGCRNFVKRCFDALNGRDSKSMEEAQKLNESAKHRCVGLTIETRADYCKKGHISEMLELGCTRVELGVQSTSDEILSKVKRGHGTKENVEAIKLLKEAGMKVCVHWMPGLTGLGKYDKKKELGLFRELFDNPDYRPDELKIYPTSGDARHRAS